MKHRLNKAFLTYYYNITGKKSKNVDTILEDVSNKNILNIEQTMDLVFVQEHASNRILSFSSHPFHIWYGEESKHIGRFAFLFLNEKDPFTKEKDDLHTIFYNKKKISEQKAKDLLYTYWFETKNYHKTGKNTPRYNKINYQLGKRLGYFQPMTNKDMATRDSKKYYINPHFGFTNKHISYDFTLYGQVIRYPSKHFSMRRIMKTISTWNQILQHISPSFYFYAIRISPPKSSSGHTVNIHYKKK